MLLRLQHRLNVFNDRIYYFLVLIHERHNGKKMTKLLGSVYKDLEKDKELLELSVRANSSYDEMQEYHKRVLKAVIDAGSSDLPRH